SGRSIATIQPDDARMLRSSRTACLTLREREWQALVWPSGCGMWLGRTLTAYDEVDYDKALLAGGLTASGSVVFGPTVGAASPWISIPAKTAAVSLGAYGAAEGGKNLGTGLATGNYGQALFGVGEGLFGIAGATASVATTGQALASTEGANGNPEMRLQRRMDLDPENDFRGDVMADGRRAETLGQNVNTTAYRFYDPNYPLMASNPRNEYRFSDPAARSTGGDVYFAEHPSVAFAEVRQNTRGKNLFSSELQATNVLDLTKPEIARSYGVDPSKIGLRLESNKDAYIYPQQVANRAVVDGYSAIRYPSVQAPGGQNIMILNGKHADVKVRPIFDVPDGEQ
ncbi:MAG: RES family NAD+ phosphorylase, partial [Xanthomonadaceae bacterium]|nr:RES family NAD+ phosphorylase [Xanthomonadaceae bacterium]